MVTVKNTEENFEQTYTIVGSEEINIEEGKISNESPLGNALLGHVEGDKITFRSPKGENTYKILKVN